MSSKTIHSFCHWRISVIHHAFPFVPIVSTIPISGPHLLHSYTIGIGNHDLGFEESLIPSASVRSFPPVVPSSYINWQNNRTGIFLAFPRGKMPWNPFWLVISRRYFRRAPIDSDDWGSVRTYSVFYRVRTPGANSTGLVVLSPIEIQRDSPTFPHRELPRRR